MNPDPDAPAQRVTIREQAVVVEGIQRPVRRALRLIERSFDRRGQFLIAPGLPLEGWATSLPASLSAQAIIALYADQGRHEQFHSELYADLDLTRLPSGKFDTNCLVCRPVALAMIILHLIGQRGLPGPDAPVRHRAAAKAAPNGSRFIQYSPIPTTACGTDRRHVHDLNSGLPLG
jgi:hypothetical protein